MSGLTIANLDQAVLADLEQLAQASGRRPDEVARAILTQVLASPSGRRIRADLIRGVNPALTGEGSTTRLSPAERVTEAERIRALGPAGVGTDSSALIRQERDQR